MLQVKVVLPGGKSRRMALEESVSLGALAEELAAELGASAAEMSLVVAGKPLRGRRAQSLATLGVRSGDAIRVSVGSPASVEDEEMTSAQTTSSAEMTSSAPCRMARHVVPADNSCLFTAVAYLLRPTGYEDLRRVVADTVRAAPDFWSAAMLGGKTADEYAAHILRRDTWGGSIELTILADHFRTQFVAVDVVNLALHQHPDPSANAFTQRAFLLWDGVHYDPLHDPARGALLFDASDDAALAAAVDLARRTHEAKQFVDASTFSLRCLVCGAGLQGQQAALHHAQATGHANFGQAS
mmetsp:Transcript_24810/g.76620  ORF Transcript_24810/g.76620 Transcript_24810/m.76620 type:complete len:298 (-) Transcript_24810:68-961(-)